MGTLAHRRAWMAVAALALAGILIPVTSAHAAEPVTVTAVMIHASNKPAPIDRRIENIEYKLRKIFKFEHYRHTGQGSLSTVLPGSGTIRLGDGHALRIDASDAGKGYVRTKVTWTRGGSELISTSTKVKRGAAPTVIGGPSQGDGKLIVTLSVR